MTLRAALFLLFIGASLTAPSQARADNKDGDTIESLQGKEVEIRPGKVIMHSKDLARDNYRAFLELAVDDPDQRAEAMRRLGDLELDATEAAQLVENIDDMNMSGYNSAVEMYEQLLEEFPDYRRNDTVMYQLGRAYEIVGRTDESLAVLNKLVVQYPNTLLIDEVQFRRGEMLFLRKKYNEAEMAYGDVVAYGPSSRFYEQSLYKLGWAQFKLAWYEECLDPFFELLDRKISDMQWQEGEYRLEEMTRADQELVEDTFRVLSIGFSYLEGWESIDSYLDRRGHPEFSYVIYRNLGDLYLEKERFVDAAEAYGASVDQDPNHSKSPLLQVEVIEAYKLGGFPTLVLEAKKDYVNRYGLEGEYWVRNAREENTAVDEHLKANLNDLAQYSHAEAQKSGEQADYQEAARWYRKYLNYFPNEAGSASTNFLLAEILFESEAFDEAADEYERTAYGYPVHEKSAEAGYAAILAYREYEQTLTEPRDAELKATWHSRYLDSGLVFADTYPEHPEAGAILTTIAEDLFAQREFDLAVTVGQAVVNKQPPVEAPLARTAWTVIAHSQFDLENFAEAEQAYYKLQAYVPVDDVEAEQDIDDRIASSIYKQGELARDMGFNEEAVMHFSRLGVVVPDSDIRATADYDAAAVLINMGAWDRASGALEQFRRDYPDSEFNNDINQKLAVTYSSAGRSADAAAEFERIAVAEASTEEVRREALWQAAELYEQSGTITSEQRVLEDIISRYPNPLSESIEARYRLLELTEQTGSVQQRFARLEDLVWVDATAGAQRSDRTRYLAAIASLELAEPVRRQFQVVKLTQPLAESLKVKRALMEEVIEVYTKSANYGVAEVTTAATFRLGEVYENFGADLLNSERPQNLDAAALEQYELLLEDQIYPFEEKAIELYMANTDRASDGVYDEWVQKSFNRLASLMPARYSKVERGEDVVTTLY
jgi:TolA-binding protein